MTLTPNTKLAPPGPTATDLSPTLLVDADFFFYRAASASEQEHEYNEELTVIVGDFRNGKRIVEQELHKLRQRFDTDKVVLYFTDRKNFRKEVCETYKGNRTKRKPCGYLKLKNWGIATYPSVIRPNLEADDSLGIDATSGLYENFVLVSPDKDMQQIPCRLYDLKTEYTQTAWAAERKLWEQTLTGDATDGYSGCPTYGPKRADQLLSKVKKSEDYWPTIVGAFESVGLSEEEALMNLRLARILQVTDWDSKTQQPILITP